VFSLVPDHPEAQAFRQQIAAAASREDPFAAIMEFSQIAGIPIALLQPPPSLEQLRAMGEGFQSMRPPDTWDAGDSVALIRDAGVPAFVVTGGWSPGMEAIGDALARGLDAERLVIDAGHHFPQIAGDPRGSEFTDALEMFLVRCG
jgi:hypothetical protein